MLFIPICNNFLSPSSFIGAAIFIHNLWTGDAKLFLKSRFMFTTSDVLMDTSHVVNMVNTSSRDQTNAALVTVAVNCWMLNVNHLRSFHYCAVLHSRTRGITVKVVCAFGLWLLWLISSLTSSAFIYLSVIKHQRTCMLLSFIVLGGKYQHVVVTALVVYCIIYVISVCHFERGS